MKVGVIILLFLLSIVINVSKCSQTLIASCCRSGIVVSLSRDLILRSSIQAANFDSVRMIGGNMISLLGDNAQCDEIFCELSTMNDLVQKSSGVSMTPEEMGSYFSCTLLKKYQKYKEIRVTGFIGGWDCSRDTHLLDDGVEKGFPTLILVDSIGTCKVPFGAVGNGATTIFGMLDSYFSSIQQKECSIENYSEESPASSLQHSIEIHKKVWKHLGNQILIGRNHRIYSFLRNGTILSNEIENE